MVIPGLSLAGWSTLSLVTQQEDLPHSFPSPASTLIDFRLLDFLFQLFSVCFNHLISNRVNLANEFGHTF